MTTYSFRQIDTAVRGMDADAVDAQLRSNDPAAHRAAFSSSYTGIRFWLLMLCAVPLSTVRWRRALTLFVRSADTLQAHPDFKAGKDL